jgi:hypothetical protein
MRNLKDTISEKLQISRNKQPRREFKDVENLTFDEFLNTFSKMNNPDIYLQHSHRSDGSNYIVSPQQNTPQSIAKYKGKKINEIYAAYSSSKGHYINIVIGTRPTSIISTKNIDDIKDVFGIEQLEELYKYILDHARN